MKKVAIVFVIASLLFASCKDQPKESTTAKSYKVEHTEHQSENDIDGNDWMQDIQLNDGSKWEANPETNEGVANMKSVIRASNPKELKDYHMIANALNDEKNFVVKECTMKGPSHDNLHVWLHPLIEKIDALKEVKSLEEAQGIYKSIEKDINAYENYFE